MRTFATFATPSSYGRAAKGGVLVGRMVANTDFVRALARHADFEAFYFFVGESGMKPWIEEHFGAELERRLVVRNALELPGALERGELSLIHYGSHLDRFLDLVWQSERHATRTVPVTGQIHSLSYPRSTNDYLRALLVPPRACDAILCSSEAGRRVVLDVHAHLAEELRERGSDLPPLECELPVVPLGVDVEALSKGDGAGLRAELGIEPAAFCALVLARFSEHDKMDLFPLLAAFRDAAARIGRPSVLLLAGSRQGTKTPEMLELWARALGIHGSLRLLVDFPEGRKRDVLAAADAFVSPTDNPQETFGLSVVEAMAAGLPVIVSDFDGYRETVTPDAGILVPTSWQPPPAELRDLGPLLYERPLHLLLGQGLVVDPDALVGALVSLANDDELRRRLARGAAARARTHYDWSAVIPRYLEVWRRLAAKTCAPRRSTRHPLALDHARSFGHYPTGELAASRRLVLSDHGRAMRALGQRQPILPELANLFDDAMLDRALELAQEPVVSSELVRALCAAFPARRPWHCERLVAWLEKHGLVRAADPGPAPLDAGRPTNA